MKLADVFGVRSAVKRLSYEAYERKLMAESYGWDKPCHLGIIMDGNRRFARDAGADDVVEGHFAGADKLEEVLDWCGELAIDVVTAWIFSIDNFARAEGEVEGLMDLFQRKFLELVTSKKIHNNRIRIRSIGRVNLLPERVQLAIRAAEKSTAHYQRRLLNVGVAYGGREEIVDAVKQRLAEAAARGESLEHLAASLCEADIDRHVYSADVPEPDLILRTSGELRLSGFLLWQSARSELYFTDANWPALRKIDFLRALRAYDRRQRRFGR
ncbi:MAG: di-trans,poly-cis-decaprenylcistransferase [Proteobacteria bacterium]|nr:MAG: di-trans,poly-cis-decaprenylcistransferase [Pseudomonadota bacterium]